ncbi:MAG: hypothetical protein WD696_15075, partial [Bryobacteraceae bacterium]
MSTHDVVAEMGTALRSFLTSLARSSTWSWMWFQPQVRPPAVGHFLSCFAGSRRVEQQTLLASRQHGEPGRRIEVNAETQLLSVERNRCLDIMNDVSNTDTAHHFILRFFNQSELLWIAHSNDVDQSFRSDADQIG